MTTSRQHTIDSILAQITDDLNYCAPIRGLASITLSPELSAECGHLEGEGAGGSPENFAARHRVMRVARELHEVTGATIEIYAQDHDMDSWIVDVVQ